MLSFVSSVMSLAMIAINRYYYVVQWKTYSSIFTPKRSALFAGIVWSLSLLLSVPPLFGWAEYRYIPGKSYCFVFWPSDVYYMYFMLTICFFGPLTIMCVSYFNILNFTREAKRRVYNHWRKDSIQPQQEIQTDRENDISFHEKRRKVFKMTQEEVKITNTLLIVVACFMICWAPFAITMFIDIYYPRPLPRAIDIGTLLLGYANSMCNPVVYGIRNQAFRRELIKLVTGCHCPSFRANRVSNANTFQASSMMACQMNAAQAPVMLEVSRLFVESLSEETNTLRLLKPLRKDVENLTESTQIDQDK